MIDLRTQQAIWDSEGETIERGRDACTPYTSNDLPRYFLAYAAILASAVLFIGLGGIT